MSCLKWGLSAQAAVMKHHGLGGLSNRKLSYCSSGGWKSKSKFSSEASWHGEQMATLSLCPHLAFPLCIWRERSLMSPPLVIWTPVLLD